MENYSVVIHYFWVIKVLFLALFVSTLYIAMVKKNFKSKTYNIIAVVFMVLFIVQPFKLQIDTQSVHKLQDKTQERLKIVPPKVTDDSFKDSVQNLKGITKEDLK